MTYDRERRELLSDARTKNTDSISAANAQLKLAD